jgi:uncharacterized membrane protein
MGLISGLLTLPLAPVRGVVWVGEQLQHEAERELDEPARARRELAALQAAFERGELDEAEFERREDELLDALEAS